MRTWNQLSQEDKNEVVTIAFEWQREHRGHVDRLLSESQARYAPSGSDLVHPERWKGEHWAWFDRGGE